MNYAIFLGFALFAAVSTASLESVPEETTSSKLNATDVMTPSDLAPTTTAFSYHSLPLNDLSANTSQSTTTSEPTTEGYVIPVKPKDSANVELNIAEPTGKNDTGSDRNGRFLLKKWLKGLF